MFPLSEFTVYWTHTDINRKAEDLIRDVKNRIINAGFREHVNLSYGVFTPRPRFNDSKMAAYMADPPTYHHTLLPLKRSLDLIRSFDGYPLSHSGLGIALEYANEYRTLMAPISDPCQTQVVL